MNSEQLMMFTMPSQFSNFASFFIQNSFIKRNSQVGTSFKMNIEKTRALKIY